MCGGGAVYSFLQHHSLTVYKDKPFQVPCTVWRWKSRDQVLKTRFNLKGQLYIEMGLVATHTWSATGISVSLFFFQSETVSRGRRSPWSEVCDPKERKQGNGKHELVPRTSQEKISLLALSMVWKEPFQDDVIVAWINKVLVFLVKWFWYQSLKSSTLYFERQRTLPFTT